MTLVTDKIADLLVFVDNLALRDGSGAVYLVLLLLPRVLPILLVCVAGVLDSVIVLTIAIVAVKKLAAAIEIFRSDEIKVRVALLLPDVDL